MIEDSSPRRRIPLASLWLLMSFIGLLTLPALLQRAFAEDQVNETAKPAKDEPRWSQSADYKRERRHLPDYSDGHTGILGPFFWSRAIDMGADASFADDKGEFSREGKNLWLYQFMRGRRTNQKLPLVHERNNLVCADSSLAFEIQPKQVTLDCPKPHNFKLITGYMQNDFHFEHGDNADLAHLAGGDRVLLFLPIRHGSFDEKRDPADQSKYFISPIYEAQSASIIEFKAGEMIHYEYFHKDNLDKRILFDLAPYLDGDDLIHPGVTHPIFRFTVDGKGGWKLCFESDGRDGLKGGKNPEYWDMIFTHESEGAKPYTVNVTEENSSWALSTFSPGGMPESSSQLLLGLKPFDRTTGKEVDWPNRDAKVRSIDLEKAIQKMESQH